MLVEKVYKSLLFGGSGLRESLHEFEVKSRILRAFCPCILYFLYIVYFEYPIVGKLLVGA